MIRVSMLITAHMVIVMLGGQDDNYDYDGQDNDDVDVDDDEHHHDGAYDVIDDAATYSVTYVLNCLFTCGFTQMGVVLDRHLTE